MAARADKREIAEHIKRTITMRQMCDHFGIHVNRQNKAICPFHNDAHASMHVYQGDGGYHCFSCGAGGSVIDFVMNMFGLTFTDAVRRINSDFGLGFDLDGKEHSEAEKAALAKAKRLREEREAKKRKTAAAKERYERVLSAWVKLDRIITEQDPAELGYVSKEWVDAKASIDSVEYELRLAEYDLAAAERSL